MADFSIKAHDQLPSIEATLTAAGDNPVDLSTAVEVRFIMRDVKLPTAKVNSPAIVVSPPVTGKVRYDWQTGDTDTPGSYSAEWEITWLGGKKQTVPTTSYHSIDVLADLDLS